MRQDAMCGCKMNLFNGLLKELCDTKPEIGTQLVMHYKETDFPCIVKSHCGHDFFYVVFTGTKPHQTVPEAAKTDGWHLSLRGYGNSWNFAK